MPGPSTPPAAAAGKAAGTSTGAAARGKAAAGARGTSSAAGPPDPAAEPGSRKGKASGWTIPADPEGSSNSGKSDKKSSSSSGPVGGTGGLAGAIGDRIPDGPGLKDLTLTPPRRLTAKDAGGFLGGLALYIGVLTYIKYGPDGLRGWLGAKFLNRPWTPPPKRAAANPGGKAAQNKNRQEPGVRLDAGGLTTTRPVVATVPSSTTTAEA